MDSKAHMGAYSKVLSDEDQEDGLSTQLRERKRQQRGICGISSGITTAIIVLLVINIVLVSVDIFYRKGSSNCSSKSSPYFFGNGTSNELPSARDAMTYSPHNMTGLYEYSTVTKKLTRKKDADIDFFGPPSHDRDMTWEHFIEHNVHDFTLLESEIQPHMLINNKDRWASDHKIHFEPEVYHVLHCLNAVRQQVNRVLYPDTMPSQDALEEERAKFKTVTDDWTVLHTEHCLDRIRQDVMCHADMTPSTFYGLDELPIALTFGSPGERICRDWGPIKQWMEDRKSVSETERG